MSIVKFEDVKALLNLEQSESAYPALTLIMDLMQPSFEEYLGVKFNEDIYTEERYIESPTKLISLEAIPVKSIASITLNDVAITDYTIFTWGLHLASKVGPGALACTYNGGLDEVPSWLRRAATLQTAYEYQTKEHIGSDYVATEGGTVGRPALQLLNDVKRILDPHRHPMTRLF